MWYYSMNDQQVGPLDDAHMRGLIANGTITPGTLVWTVGMANWLPLSQTRLGRAQTQPQPGEPGLMQIAPAAMVDREVESLNVMFTWMWITLILSLVTFGVSLLATVTLFFIIVYKCWALVQDGHARTTPDQAIAFSFIPVVQFWWWFPAFKGLAKDMNRVMANEGIAGQPVSEGVALWYVISLLASPLGLPIIAVVVLGIILTSQYKNAAATIIYARKNKAA